MDHFDRRHRSLPFVPTNQVVRALFWLHVRIPIAWRVANTLTAATKLFG
ncbi:oxalate:formate antiporter [Burkholderia sp. KBS0801]|nr:oxalate:formate antiporter [Burkholderia sp. KBS0801]